MQLVDTHCHLDFEPIVSTLDEVLRRAASAGVTRVVAPSFDAESRRKIVDLGKRHSIFPALGLHPWAAGEQLDLGELADQVHSCGAVAIGEIGLDTKIDQPDLRRQIEVFDMQIRLAVELDLPVILHCRGAFDEMLNVLGEQPTPVRGVIHAYSRGPELAFRLLNAGLMLGIGGASTRPRARRLHRTLKRVPVDRLVLETDAPSIGLEGVAAEHTEPQHVAAVAQAVAELAGVKLSEVARKTTQTAEALFGGLRAR